MDCSPPGSSVHGNSPGKNTGVGCHVLLQGIFPTQVSHVAGRFFTVWATRKKKKEREVSQSCLTLCNPMDCSLPGFSIHGIFQARILEWVAISFSRRSFQPRDWTRVSRIVWRRFTVWATREFTTREVCNYWNGWPIPSPRDLSNPGIKLGSPALQADSLPVELQGIRVPGFQSIFFILKKKFLFSREFPNSCWALVSSYFWTDK